MTDSGYEVDSIDAVLASLRASGYRVLRGPAATSIAPVWLKRFEPDLVAQRGDEFVVVEVQHKRPAAQARIETGQLSELAAAIDRHPGWGLELVWLGEEEAPVSGADIEALIRRAEKVVAVDIEAALLLIWAAVQSSVRVLASRAGLRGGNARQLLSELYSLGWLSEALLVELEDAQQVRNLVAHRVGAANVEQGVVSRLADIARRLADPQYASVDQMVEWFQSLYMDPANGVPFASSEGGYMYVNGGPYDALEVLVGRYPDALPEELEAARDVLEQESYEWVQRDEY